MRFLGGCFFRIILLSTKGFFLNFLIHFKIILMNLDSTSVYSSKITQQITTFFAKRTCQPSAKLRCLSAPRFQKGPFLLGYSAAPKDLEHHKKKVQKIENSLLEMCHFLLIECQKAVTSLSKIYTLHQKKYGARSVYIEPGYCLWC